MATPQPAPSQNGIKSIRLVYYEEFDNLEDAIAREKEIKHWRRAKKNDLVETLNPKWDDLRNDLFGE